MLSFMFSKNNLLKQIPSVLYKKFSLFLISPLNWFESANDCLLYIKLGNFGDSLMPPLATIGG